MKLLSFFTFLIMAFSLNAQNTSLDNIVFSFGSNFPAASGTGLTGIGTDALLNSTSGSFNTGIGNSALKLNTTGSNNTGIGQQSLSINTTGSNNTAVGKASMNLNTTGTHNVALGIKSLKSNTTGSLNIGVGINSLNNNSTGSNNTSLGSFSGVTLDGLTNATALGFKAFATASNYVRIGNPFVTNIEGRVAFTSVSDRKFKSNIQPSELGLDFILQLNPVNYNMEGHGRILYTGFIAQEVDDIVNDMEVEWSGVKRPANETDHYGLRYAEFTVPLVKAIQEQQIQIAEIKEHSNKSLNNPDAIEELISKVDAIQDQQYLIDNLQSENKALKDRLNKIEELLSQNEIIQNLEITLEGKKSDALVMQNVPNPFTAITAIRTNIPQEVLKAELIITDRNGQILSEKIISERGQINTTINAQDLPQGSYIYTLILDGQKLESKTMVLIK